MNVSRSLLLSLLLTLLPALTAAMSNSAAILVANSDELSAAVSVAKPGSTIVLRNGTWKDVRIELSAAGTAAEPITVRAETAGQVILTGASTLNFMAPYVTVEGLQFRGGALTSGSVVRFNSDHDQLLDSAIIDYNPPDEVTSYYWAFFDGSDNRVERCLFQGKTHMGPLIGNAIKNARRNAVVASLIRDMGSSHGRNGMEMFRIWGYGGNEELGDDGAYFTVEGNLFDHADGESMEIISLKSNRNRVVNNTIRATMGGITNRSGNFNTIAGNIILCEGRSGAYGIRATGQRQHIYNNYISGCDYGITLMSGEFIDRDLTGKYEPIKREGTPLGRVPRYGWVRESELVHNTMIDNAGPDIVIGGAYKSGWPGAQRFLLPEDNLIANNLIVKGKTGTPLEVVADTNPPLDTFKFKPNRFGRNIVFGGEAAMKPLPSGFITADPKLSASPDGLMRPAQGSPVTDAAVKAGMLSVEDDIDGQPRDRRPDVGADEISKAAPNRRPLTAGDVGPTWLRRRGTSPGLPGAHLNYAPGKAPKFWSVATAETIMARYPDYREAYWKPWTYVQGYMFYGFEMLYRSTGDKRYLDYIKRYVDQFVDENGNYHGDKLTNLDNLMTGSSVVTLYEYTHEERYKTAAQQFRRVFDTYPRSADGQFWHGNGSPNMWIDGIFMGQMFLIRYGRVIGDSDYAWDEATRQITVFARHCLKGDSGLYLHAWTENVEKAKWADPKTGLSPEVWSEGLGWYALILSETLAVLPKNHPRRAKVEAIYRHLADGLKRTQDKSGGWYMIVDKGDQPGNWIDPSGTAMFVYAIQRGVELGLLNKKDYAPVVDRGFKSLVTFARINDRGLVDIEGGGDGISIKPDYATYINVKRVTNAKEAVGGFLWAAAIVEKPRLEKARKH